MRFVSKTTFLKWSINLSLTFLLALVTTQIIRMYLPQEGLSHQSHDTFVARHLYRLSSAFFETKIQEEVTQTPQEQLVASNYATLRSWRLQALYKKGDLGFIVVKILNETHYLNVHDTLEGYLLKDIQHKEALLTRDGKEYRLGFDDEDRIIPPMITKPVRPLNVKELEEGIVHRADINDYMADTDKIWNNIKIAPYKVNDSIKGFAVRYVRKESVFDKLGLINGDIIIEANGVPMTSIEKAEQLYKHIDQIDNVAIIITRNGTQKELQYEIK